MLRCFRPTRGPLQSRTEGKGHYPGLTLSKITGKCYSPPTKEQIVPKLAGQTPQLSELRRQEKKVAEEKKRRNSHPGEPGTDTRTGLRSLRFAPLPWTLSPATR